MPDITFTVSLEHANIIMKHLGNGPFVEVSPVVAELQKQAAPQVNPAPEAV